MICWLLEGNWYFKKLKILLFWWKWKASVGSMGFYLSMLFTSDCAMHRTWICWLEHGSIETEHESGEWNMDLVVPFQIEHGSQIIKDGLSSSVWSVRLLFHMEVHFCRSLCYGLILGLCQRWNLLRKWRVKLKWPSRPYWIYESLLEHPWHLRIQYF